MRPAVEGRCLSAEESVALTPQKMELVDGAIPGGEGLLLLLLTQFGLRRAADLVGHERWQSAVSEPRSTVEADPGPAAGRGRSDDRSQEALQIANLRGRRERLQKALQECSGHWGFEDPIYRFYHQSFKVYAIQKQTEGIVRELSALLPEVALDPWFMDIVVRGTDRRFDPGHNRDWPKVTRPMLEAFFHARFFLEMAVRYADLESPPNPLPSGYAALLCLYGLR